MLKKLLYTIMFSISLIVLVLMLFTPIYKFNDEKISKNNTEMLALLQEPTLAAYRSKAALSKLSDESQEEYKRNYKIYNNLALAIIEEDPDKYYDAKKYAILNEIYVVQIGGEAPLEPLSTDAELDLVEKTLKDLLGESEFESERLIETYSQLNSDKADIYDKVKESTGLKTNEEVENFLTNNAINWIADEFLLAYFGYDYELIELSTADFRKKGIYLRHIVNAWKNAWVINKSVWNQEAYQSLGLIDRVKSVTSDANFYNPLPLIGLSTILLCIIIGLVGLIFKGLQGIRGVRYPHAFINSIFNGAVTLGLLMLSSFITSDYYLSYHITEYSRLLNLLMFGNFGLVIYGSLLAFAIGVAVSVLGRFFRWGRKKED